MADENNQGAPEGGGSEGSEGGEALASKASAEEQQRARDAGWIPPEEWRGPRENFTDADEFLRRADSFVPFLRKERARLQGDLSVRDQQIAGLQEQNQRLQAQVNELTEFRREMSADRNRRRKEELNGLIHKASESGDEAAAATHRAELQEIVTQERGNGEETRTREDSVRQPPQMQPWVRNWLSGQDAQDFLRVPHQADVFNGVVARMRAGGDRRVGEVEGPAFLSDAMAKAREALGVRVNSRREEPGRTEESRQSGSAGAGRRSGGKGYADMPADARAKCDKDEKRFVGTTKQFKDQASFRRYFAAEYFGPSSAAAERMLERQ